MRLPQRFNTHVLETISGKIFNDVMPDDWIVREVTERDYGVDFYVEICENGFVTGKMFSVQLKSSENPYYEKRHPFVAYYDVSPETINYWSLLPTPVLFVYVDTNKKECFFCDVNKYIRENYYSFKKEELTSIKIPTTQVLKKGTSGKLLNDMYLVERERPTVEMLVLDFITSVYSNHALLQEHVGRDSFMEIEGEDELKIYKMMDMLKNLASFFGVKWIWPTMNDLIDVVYRQIGTSRCVFRVLHEGKMTEHGKKLVEAMRSIATEIFDLVINKEREYWCSAQPKIYEYMLNFDPQTEIPDLC